MLAQTSLDKSVNSLSTLELPPAVTWPEVNAEIDSGSGVLASMSQCAQSGAYGFEGVGG